MELVPQIEQKKKVEGWLEVGRCPWAGLRETEWRWWMKTREEEERQQKPSRFEWPIRSCDPENRNTSRGEPRT